MGNERLDLNKTGDFSELELRTLAHAERLSVEQRQELKKNLYLYNYNYAHASAEIAEAVAKMSKRMRDIMRPMLDKVSDMQAPVEAAQTPEDHRQHLNKPVGKKMQYYHGRRRY